MIRRIGSLLLGLAMLTPTFGVAALAMPASAAAVGNSCNVQAYIQQTGGTSFKGKGYVYCSQKVTDFKIVVRAQRCTLDIFGCRAWEDISSWTDYSLSYVGGTYSFTGPWHTFTQGFGNRVRVVADAWYNGAGYYAGGGISSEITN